MHPSQYTQPHHQEQAPQPPYPTTPGPTPSAQPQAYFPPTPQQQQPMYSTSPSSPWQQPPSPWLQQPYSNQPQGSYPPQTSMPFPHHRRSSSTSQSSGPHNFQQQQPFTQTAPISIPQTYYSQPGPPVYARSAGSHHNHNHHVHDHHTYGDGEDGTMALDEETLRSYEKRYAKDRELEKRPTLGGSVLSMFKALGSSKRE
jgi:hypothetical protein